MSEAVKNFATEAAESDTILSDNSEDPFQRMERKKIVTNQTDAQSSLMTKVADLVRQMKVITHEASAQTPFSGPLPKKSLAYKMGSNFNPL